MAAMGETRRAPKLINARSSLIIALALLMLLVSPADAQTCSCTYGTVSYNGNVRCWYSGPGTGSYVLLPYNYRYRIYCQRTGGSVGGNIWWNRIIYGGRYCYVNDYYLTTGCANRCYNLPIC